MQDMVQLPEQPEPEQVKFLKINSLTVRLQAFRSSTIFSKTDTPVDLAGHFVLKLETPEETYKRKIIIGTDRQLLNLAWVTSPTYVMIKNITEWEGNLLPTPEEQADVDARKIEMGPKEKPDWLTIPPGCSQSFLFPCSEVYIRCQHATAKFEVFAI